MDLILKIFSSCTCWSGFVPLEFQHVVLWIQMFYFLFWCCAVQCVLLKIVTELTDSPATLLPTLLPVLQQHTYIHSDTGSESSSFARGISPVSKQRCSISLWCQSGMSHRGPRLMQYLITLIHCLFGNHTQCLCFDQNWTWMLQSVLKKGFQCSISQLNQEIERESSNQQYVTELIHNCRQSL